MHGLMWFAGLLGLVALAFGQDASIWLARAIVVLCGLLALFCLWIGFMVVTERL